MTGQQLTEATHINKSLSALGDVVGALAGRASTAAGLGAAHPGPTSRSPEADSPKKPAAGAGARPVPYRNSKLTLLLQEALHGRSKVLLYATASPELTHWAETHAALAFAARCRSVETHGRGGALPPGDALAATEAELAAANRRVHELTAQLRLRGVV